MNREGSLVEKILADGREAVIYPLITGTVRLVVGEPDVGWFDDAW